MDQTRKSYVCLTATLGAERVAAKLSCAAPVARNRLAADFTLHPESEIIELLIMGCVYDFHSHQGRPPRHYAGPHE